jgi:DNA-binding transcriptional regulator GbsR (MarR family)
MPPDEATFGDRLGLFMEILGATRTTGRVDGWLLICDPPQQSLTELAATLCASRASVRTLARQMQEGGMIERLPSATRQHHYRVTPGGLSRLLDTQLSLMKPGIDVADFGLSVLARKAPNSGSGSKTSGTSARVLRTGLPR